eukprot:scaffold59035_cov63-Phaeocystis_antarctica.AAC.7
MRVVESPKNTSHRPANCRVRQAGVRHGALCAECRSSKRASSGSVQSLSRPPACQVSSPRRGCGWPPHCRLPTGVAAPGGSRPHSYAESTSSSEGARVSTPPTACRLHVAALRGHCESHEGAVLVASSAVCHGAALERKPAGLLSSRLRSQLEYHEQSGLRPALSETNRQRLQRAQRCKHATAACVRLRDPSRRFSRVPPKEPRSPRLHVPSDPSSVSPQKPGRAEASHASALRAVTFTGAGIEAAAANIAMLPAAISEAALPSRERLAAVAGR